MEAERQIVSLSSADVHAPIQMTPDYFLLIYFTPGLWSITYYRNMRLGMYCLSMSLRIHQTSQL